MCRAKWPTRNDGSKPSSIRASVTALQRSVTTAIGTSKDGTAPTHTGQVNRLVDQARQLMESAPPAMKVEDTNTKGQLPSCELTVGACQPVCLCF